MNVTEADILKHRKEGPWRKLSGIAAGIVADAEKTAGSSLHALLGGGTRIWLSVSSLELVRRGFDRGLR